MAPKNYNEPRKGLKKYKLIKNRIDTTLDYMQRRRYNGHVDWERYIRNYRSLQWAANIGRQKNPSSDDPNETIVFNEIGTIVQSILPFLVKRMPKIKCKPNRAEEAISSILQEKVANYNWRKFKYQEQLKLGVLDLLIIGNMFTKSGYKLEPDLTKKGTGNITYADFIKADNPFAVRIAPHLVLFDMDSPYHSLDSARWCVEIQFAHPGDILGDESMNKQNIIDEIATGKYKPESVQSLMKSHIPTASWDEMPDGEDERWIRLLYWDKKFDEHMIFIHGVPFPIHEVENPFKGILDGFPIHHSKLIDIPNDPFGIGIPAWIEDPQYELNRHATKVFQHRRRHMGGQYNYVGVDEVERVKHQNGESVITQSPDSITPIPVAPLPHDDYATLDLIKTAIRDYSAWSEFARSGMLQDRASATQANIVQSNLTARVDYMVSIVDEHVIRMARDMLALVKAFWAGEKVVELTGPMGQYWGKMTGNPAGPDGRYFVEYSQEDIQGESDIEIESTSAERWNPQMERQQRMSLLQAAAQLKQLISMEGQDISIAEMLKWVLEAFPDKDVGRFFPIANIQSAPLQPVTELQLKQGGGPQVMQPNLPTLPGIPPAQQEVQTSAVNPTSDILGALFGGLTLPQS